MKKIRKFEGGGNVRSDDPSVDRAADAEEARYKAAGLSASNAKKESSGFLGLGRLFQGNIDQKGSEAYEKYGAGAGRRLEAEKAAADTKRNGREEDAPVSTQRTGREEDAPVSTQRTGREEDAPVSTQRTGREEDAPVSKSDNSYADLEKKRFASPRSTVSPGVARVTEDMPTKRPEVGGQVTTGDARVAEYANAFPSNRDEGVRAAKRGSGATAAKPAAAKPAAANTTSLKQRDGREEDRAVSNSGSAGQKGPSRADLENDARRGFAANPMSKDPSQRSSSVSGPRSVVNPSTGNPTNPTTEKSVKPLSQAELRAQAAIARATGNSSGSASNKRVPTPSEAGQNIKNAAEKVGNAFSSIANSFKKEKYKEKNEKAKGGAIKGYASRGSVSSRGDGIAQRGKTRGKMC